MKSNEGSLLPNLAPLWENCFGKDFMEKAGWGSVCSVLLLILKRNMKPLRQA
jgi:hypothetical protein